MPDGRSLSDRKVCAEYEIAVQHFPTGPIVTLASGGLTRRYRAMIEHRDYPPNDPFGCLCDDCTSEDYERAVAERERLRAENQMLREAITDALTDCRPGYAPFSLLDDVLRTVELARGTDEVHAHQWTTTGRADTGHQPPRLEYECAGCDEREWTNDPAGPSRDSDLTKEADHG